MQILTRSQKNRLRKERQNLRKRPIDSDRCPHCGSIREWCTICNTWSCHGCDPYGTCMCN